MGDDLPQIDLSKGTVVKDLWKVLRRLGEGGCGVIYEVENVRWAEEQRKRAKEKTGRSVRRRRLLCDKFENKSSLRATQAPTPKTPNADESERKGGGKGGGKARSRGTSVKKTDKHSDKTNKVPATAGSNGTGSALEIKLPPRAALKAEPAVGNKDDEVLKMEVHVMKQLQNSKHVVKLYTCGRENNFNFIVMELLGSNLSDLRRDCPGQKFTKSTAIRLGMQCLQAIQDVHEASFVHRDVKPSNFALGAFTETKRIVYILDFGLTRSWRTKDKATNKWVLRKPRSNVAFRGTLRYCSLNVHKRLEQVGRPQSLEPFAADVDGADNVQGRHDDLWSLAYMLIEFITGSLPWRNADAEHTVQLKETTSRAVLTAGCPKQIGEMLLTLRPYTYSSDPDYAKVHKLLSAALLELAGCESEPYDWELGGRYYDFFRTHISAAARARPDPACDVTERTANANEADRSAADDEPDADAHHKGADAKKRK